MAQLTHTVYDAEMFWNINIVKNMKGEEKKNFIVVKNVIEWWKKSPIFLSIVL